MRREDMYIYTPHTHTAHTPPTRITPGMLATGVITDCNSPDFNGVDGILGFGLPKAREHSSTINVLLMCC
jgi:hypothetical protein